MHTVLSPGSALFSSKKEETTPFSVTSPRDRMLATSKQVVGMLAAAVSAAVLGGAAVEAENGSNGNGDNGNKSSSSVVVLGAGGQTGKLVVKRLAALGVPALPTMRSVNKKSAALFANLANIDTPLAADVTDASSLKTVLKDAKTVIFAASASARGNAKEVDFLGLENVAKVCVDLKIPKLVVISSGAITRPDSIAFKFTNIFGNVMNYKLMGENAMKAVYASSGDDSLSYVIVRPGGLLDGEAAGPAAMELNQGDTVSGELSRDDVADCVVSAALSQVVPRRVTFELYTRSKRSVLQKTFPSLSGYERSGASYDEMFKGLTAGDVVI